MFDPITAGIMVGGSLIGNLAGGLMSQGSAQGAAANQWAMANQNYMNQKEFAQNAIQWRAADAKAAGIHPLYALGSAGAGYSPSTFIAGGDDIGHYASQFGQDIGRAVAAGQTKADREMTIEDILMREQNMERGALQNELLRSQIASINARTQKDQLGPPMPALGGVVNSGSYEVKPNEITSSQPDMPSNAAGPPAPSNQYRVGPDGARYVTPEKNLQMDDFGSPGWIPWMYRNHVIPFAKEYLGQDNQYAAPPLKDLPYGAHRWKKQIDGSWVPDFSWFDREVQRSRHGQSYPEPAYDRRR